MATIRSDDKERPLLLRPSGPRGYLDQGSAGCTGESARSRHSLPVESTRSEVVAKEQVTPRCCWSGPDVLQFPYRLRGADQRSSSAPYIWGVLRREKIATLDALEAVASQTHWVPGIGCRTARVIRAELARVAAMESSTEAGTVSPRLDRECRRPGGAAPLNEAQWGAMGGERGVL